MASNACSGGFIDFNVFITDTDSNNIDKARTAKDIMTKVITQTLYSKPGMYVRIHYDVYMYTYDTYTIILCTMHLKSTLFED